MTFTTEDTVDTEEENPLSQRLDPVSTASTEVSS